MFALQSCKGFSPNTYHIRCCTNRHCDIQYSEKEINDLGYSLPFALEFLTCHELQPSITNSSVQGSTGSPRTSLLGPLLAAGLAAAIALASVLLWRHQRARQRNSMKADELPTEQSVQELEIRHQSSHKRPAGDWPHTERWMDVQAQTDYNNFVTVDSILNGTNDSSKLTVRSMQHFHMLYFQDNMCKPHIPIQNANASSACKL
jgi:hypothetical protein